MANSLPPSQVPSVNTENMDVRPKAAYQAPFITLLSASDDTQGMINPGPDLTGCS